MKDQYKAGMSMLIVLALSIAATGNRHSKVESSTKANSQLSTTCSGISLTSQAQVDAFPSTYGCSVINGGLTISGSDITNLDSLYSITQIDGDPGGLSITGNPLLKNINGLSSLSNVGYGWVYISNNPSLTNLNGLSSLKQIRGYKTAGGGL